MNKRNLHLAIRSHETMLAHARPLCRKTIREVRHLRLAWPAVATLATFLTALVIWLALEVPVHADPPVGTLTRLHSFGDLEMDGVLPVAGVVEGSDGALYGTAYYGGTFGHGTVFRLNKDGSDFAVLKNFDGGADGGTLNSGLIEGSDGALYGTAYSGGAFEYGTVFRLNRDGTGFTVLKDFDYITHGGQLSAGLVEGTDGLLYGTASGGGPFGYGTVYRLNKNGGGFEVVKNFDGGADGGSLNVGLIEATDGMLYGATIRGGVSFSSFGTVFRLNKDGSGFQILKNNFDVATDGKGVTGLIEGMDGLLYGTTVNGGVGAIGPFGGTVFRMNKDGTRFDVLRSFSPGTGGGLLTASLTQGSDGALYGTAHRGGAFGYGSVFRLKGDGTGFEVLQNFGGEPGGPQHPGGKVILDAAGRIYGTSNYGGDANMGTVFSIDISSLSTPILSSLSPASATANGTGFTLLINGSGFPSEATVHWNGSARPSSFVNNSQISATINSTDLSSATDIATAIVTVKNGVGATSNPLVFSIVGQSVGNIVAAVAPPGGTAFASTAPSASGEAGVALSVSNTGGDPITATAATYDSRPVGETAFRVDNGAFVDVQINGADSSDSATVYFYYPSTVTGGQENSVKLRYFDGANWIIVLSSGGTQPIKNTTDNLDGTISGGRFCVVFDNTSTPKITELNGTVFGMIDTTPQIGTLSGPAGPVTLGSAATITVPFAVLGNWAAARVTFIWDDGTQTTVAPGSSTLTSATKTYSPPGVYTVNVRVTDSEGNSSEKVFEYVVVYDPNGGFVTGGGWITSPAGAYVEHPALSGKATFGFVSKYQKGANIPTGETEFQLHFATFNFKSTSYQWLVVSGARAQFKGVGTINGSGNYAFLLTATDGQVSGGGGVDKFRIKIWNASTGAVVYDNVPGASEDIDAANPQALGGGSIVIQKSK